MTLPGSKSIADLYTREAFQEASQVDSLPQPTSTDNATGKARQQDEVPTQGTMTRTRSMESLWKRMWGDDSNGEVDKPIESTSWFPDTFQPLSPEDYGIRNVREMDERGNAPESSADGARRNNTTGSHAAEEATESHDVEEATTPDTTGRAPDGSRARRQELQARTDYIRRLQAGVTAHNNTYPTNQISDAQFQDYVRDAENDHVIALSDAPVISQPLPVAPMTMTAGPALPHRDELVMTGMIKEVADTLTDQQCDEVAKILVSEGVLSQQDVDSMKNTAACRDPFRAFCAGCLVTTSSFGVGRAMGCIPLLTLPGAGAIIAPFVSCLAEGCLNSCTSTIAAKGGLGARYRPDVTHPPPDRTKPYTEQFKQAMKGQWPFLWFTGCLTLAGLPMIDKGYAHEHIAKSQALLGVASSTSGGLTGLTTWCCGPANRKAMGEMSFNSINPKLFYPTMPNPAGGAPILDEAKLRANIKSLRKNFAMASLGYGKEVWDATKNNSGDGCAAAFSSKTLGNWVALAATSGLGAAAGAVTNIPLKEGLTALGNTALIAPITGASWMTRDVMGNMIGDGLNKVKQGFSSLLSS